MCGRGQWLVILPLSHLARRGGGDGARVDGVGSGDRDGGLHGLRISLQCFDMLRPKRERKKEFPTEYCRKIATVSRGSDFAESSVRDIA